MSSNCRTGLVFAALGAVAACGGPGARDLVGMDQVPGSSDAPKIARIVDLGDVGLLPPRGEVPQGDSDNVYVMGELVLVEGEDFGKLPALQMGGAPVDIVARTGAGGIVARIPPGIDAGPTEVTVTHPGGRDATTIETIRSAVVIDRAAGTVHVLALGRGDTGRAAAAYPIPGASFAAFSPDAQVAYVVANPTTASGSATMYVIALTSSGGPKLLPDHRLGLPQVTAFATSTGAPLGAVAGSGKLVLLDLGVPRTPTVGQPFPLVGDALALAIHPTGKRIVALSPHDNKMTPLDLSDRRSPRVELPVDLLPGEREPMAVDLEFAPGGEEVWAVCGDGPESLAGGTHPTRLVVVSWETNVPAVHRTADLAAAGAPLGISVGRRESIGSATAIRSTRRRAPIVVASVSPQLYSREPGFTPSKVADLGQLVSADLDGRAQVLLTQTALYGEPSITHDLTRVLSPTVRLVRGAGGTEFELGLTMQPMPGTPGATRYLKLAAATPAALVTPPRFALAP